jgi:formylglycine-generating enzyme required for sulfatase activity
MNVQSLDTKEYEEIKKLEEERLREAKEERERKIEPEKKKKKLEKERAKEELPGTKRENGEIKGGQVDKTSLRKKFIAFMFIIGILALGYWGLAPGGINPSQPLIDQKTYTNSIGMEFLSIPAGEFDMGSPSNEAGRWVNEGPVHQVKISNAFYMGKYEVTQKQWRDVMGNSPSYFKGDNLPVELVSWNDTQDFIQKLNEKEGGAKYRLPSEAEWEYAARAGTTTRYSFGNDESIFGYYGSKLGDYAWYSANSGSKTHDVGQKKPNPWGLYDMHGNVWEWVQDNWHDNYNGAPTDGSSWERGSDRVARGGSWDLFSGRCRSAVRNDNGPGSGTFLGFRLLRVS